MDEYILRQEVIKKLDELDSRLMRGHYVDECAGVTMANAVVQSVPAADVKPVVHGKWKVTGTFKVADYNYTVVEQRCSACGHCSIRFKNKAESNYCPKCGATMDEEEHNNV